LSPPVDHNFPGLPTLSHEEIICVEKARAALATMRMQFENWMAIARALRVIEDKAARMGGRTLLGHRPHAAKRWQLVSERFRSAPRTG
jgi:hypothetical protein